MEQDNQAQAQQQQVPANPQPEVGFPQPKEPSGGKSKIIKWIIALVGIILIVAVGAFFILQDVGQGETTSTDSEGSELTTFPTPESQETPEPTPSPTPEPIEKSEVRIEVLNGTGTPGDAGFLQDELEDLGFEEIEVGNADSQDEDETTVTYSRDLPPNIIDEMTARLEELYDSVSARQGTLSGDFDIRVITGPRVSSGTSSSDTDTTETEDTEEETTSDTGSTETE